MVVGSVDCVGGEAPDTEACRDVCGTANETGVNRYVERDCYDGKLRYSERGQMHSPFRQWLQSLGCPVDVRLISTVGVCWIGGAALGSHAGVLITLGDATLATVVAGVAILGLLLMTLAGLP